MERGLTVSLRYCCSGGCGYWCVSIHFFKDCCHRTQVLIYPSVPVVSNIVARRDVAWNLAHAWKKNIVMYIGTSRGGQMLTMTSRINSNPPSSFSSSTSQSARRPNEISFVSPKTVSVIHFHWVMTTQSNNTAAVVGKVNAQYTQKLSCMI